MIPTHYISSQEFAKRIGRDESMIRRYIREGKIKSATQQGKKTYYVDPDLAYEELQSVLKVYAPTHSRPLQAPQIPQNTRASIPDYAPAPQSKRDTGNVPDYAKARAISEATKAKLLLIELEREQAKVIDKTEVVETARKVFAEIRTKLETLAPQVAIVSENKPSHFIENEIRTRLDDIFKEIQEWPED